MSVSRHDAAESSDRSSEATTPRADVSPNSERRLSARPALKRAAAAPSASSSPDLAALNQNDGIRAGNDTPSVLTPGRFLDGASHAAGNPSPLQQRAIGTGSAQAVDPNQLGLSMAANNLSSPSTLSSGPASSIAYPPSTDSARTIRGEPTPYSSHQPLRTPSYPFPYVPGSPQPWSAGLHRPFTVLSPTSYGGLSNKPAEATLSGDIARGATFSPFAPRGTTFHPPSDTNYPSPNLYDAVLQLNAEPGLQAWWANLTKILHDSYLADRVTLALPADLNDIENVPWGQKATFNVLGKAEPLSHGARSAEPGSPVLNFSSQMSSPTKPRALQARPGLESRHSYSGIGIHGRGFDSNTEDRGTTAPARPRMPARAATQAPISSRGDLPTRTRLGILRESSHASFNDPDFSSIGDDRRFIPHTAVFTVLRGLDDEFEALIDTSGVNRIVQRGRMVTLTRDYVSVNSKKDETPKAAEAPAALPQAPDQQTSRTGPFKAPIPFRSVLSTEELPGRRRSSLFEEYEQQPPSPWSQSPAPSPAIQADPDENPFFTEGDPVADSFDPSATTPDYSAFPAVEAIGVDRASTIIHIPLFPPDTNSKSFSAMDDPSQLSSPEKRVANRRRAPVAVISLLSPAAPYPSNLTQSLKMLAPHLASTFSIAHQFTMLQEQTVRNAQRRATNRHYGVGASRQFHEGIDSSVDRDFDDATRSLSGSFTSTSEYSGRSKHSPSSSIAGTPGWDASTQSHHTGRLTAESRGEHSIEGEGYFERRRGNMARTTSDASMTLAPLPTPSKGIGMRSKPYEYGTKKSGQDSDVAPQRARGLSSASSEKSPSKAFARREQSPSRQPAVSRSDHAGHGINRLQSTRGDGPSRLHSVLHSYGADFGASFQGLPEIQTQGHGESGVPHTPFPAEDPDMAAPSERLLRIIIESLPVQIFTAAPVTGDLTWVNSKLLVYRGLDSRELMKNPWQSLHPDDVAQYREQWSRCLRDGQQLQHKVRLRRFDGNYRWFYVRAAPLKDKKQTIVHWVGTYMDVHEQHIAELSAVRQQETAASEAKYRALANSSPQTVFAVNRSKGVTFCNTQWANYSGQTEEQALGLGFVERVHPDDIIKCRLPTFEGSSPDPTNVPTSVPSGPSRSFSASQASSSGSSETEKEVTSPFQPPPSTHMPQRKLSDLASTGILKVTRDSTGKASYSTEVRLKSKEGGYRWHLVRVVLADRTSRGSDEEETWYGTCTDIDDHKALEKDLKDTMDEKSRFLSNMSHEIRTPLNGITGMVNFLIDSDLTEEQMEHVSIIRASVEGLRGLINDILDLSKAEAGMIQLSTDWVHVRALIEEVNDLTSALAIDKGLELNYVVEANVPPQVKGDRFRIRQILLNIIGNAIKFTQTGEVFVRCSVFSGSHQKLKANETLIQFEVIDTGRGFTDKEAEHLFKRFSQIDGSITKQHGGTGLGLVISKQLAQLHGGDMSAKGQPGKGATFVFFVKTILPSESDMPPVDIMTPLAAPEHPSQKGKAHVGASHDFQSLAGKMQPRKASSANTPPSDMVKATHSVSNSSAGSEPSTKGSRASMQSGSSSASSFVPEVVNPERPQVQLTMPKHPSGHAEASKPSIVQGGPKSPPMYSILVVCPLKYSRAATVQHIEMTVPQHVPHKITARESLLECQRMIGGEEAMTFSHVVLVLQSVSEIVAFMDQLITTSAHSNTQLIVITDLNQRHKIMAAAPKFDYEELTAERRLRFIFKPMKPSKFGVIFDPRKEREMSTDRNQDSAQQVALTQKQLYDDMTRRLGNRGIRVLLVEDNKVNQMVLLKLLGKVAVTVETVFDGVQCTDKVYAKPHGYYSIILCDLHMPNKDGYQTCKEIRRWEKHNKHPYMPIIALSANVLGDVYSRCVEAGFNSYVTKPVDFKELSSVMFDFLDPAEPGQPISFMRPKKKEKTASHGG